MIDYSKRITPEEIFIGDLKPGMVFVFGSNESGIHGSGAAEFARKELGYPKFQGTGLSSNALAMGIPTKDWFIQTLPLDVIEFYVKRAIALMRDSPEFSFLVTKIGCGLAGYTPEDIAPLFEDTINLRNVSLPQDFWDILLGDEVLKMAE